MLTIMSNIQEIKKNGNKHLKWNVYIKKNVRNVVIISINLYAQKNL